MRENLKLKRGKEEEDRERQSSGRKNDLGGFLFNLGGGKSRVSLRFSGNEKGVTKGASRKKK